ncbi:uncharacterized protein [Cherax quadricarinatus]|uniref:uncharacterized protein n=1 Tax=Cherax quadricarinatus TaxID=27406 RepID=UPI00387EC9D9
MKFSLEKRVVLLLVLVVTVGGESWIEYLEPSHITSLINIFPQLNIASGTARILLAAAGFACFKAALIIEAVDLARRSREKDAEDYAEFFGLQPIDNSPDTDNGASRRYAYAAPETGLTPPKHIPQHSSYGHIVRGHPPRHHGTHRRHKRFINEEVEEAQKLLISAAFHLDIDSCVFKLLCHLNNKQENSFSVEEYILLELLANSPETLSSYNVALLQATEVGQVEDQAICKKVFPSCPLGEEELGSLLRQTWGCGSTPL